MKFAEKKSLKLINGNYLATNEDQPVTHTEFVEKQKQAHYLVSLAKAIEGKNFKQTTPDSLSDVMNQVSKQIASEKLVKYVDAPKEPKNKLQNDLKKEALAWLNFQNKKEDNLSIEKEMQQFNIINQYETVGLYMEEGLVQLTNIYTIEEILEATKAVKKVM